MLCAVGDGLTQAVEWRMQIMSPEKTGYNFSRTLRMAIYGLMAGPLYATWYRCLDVTSKAASVSYEPLVSGKLAQLITRSPAATSLVQRSSLLQWATSLHKEEALSHSPLRVLGYKVVADALLASPCMLHAYFMSIGVLEGRSCRDIFETAQVNFHRAWGLSLVVWTPVQMLNFHFVPIHFQALFVSAVNVGWKMTLSLINHYHDYGTAHLRSTRDATAAELRTLRSRCASLEAANEELRKQLRELSSSFSRDAAAIQPKHGPLQQAAAHYAAMPTGDRRR